MNVARNDVERDFNHLDSTITNTGVSGKTAEAEGNKMKAKAYPTALRCR